MTSTTKRRGFRAVTALLCLCLLLGGALASCAQKTTPIAELNDYAISENMYTLFLSRIKGTLARQGYSVDSSTFWEMVVDENSTTYDEYFRQAALTDTRRYLAAMVLFDEEGLVLPKTEKEKIDAEIEEFISDAGSKSELNSILGKYGMNVDMLRDLYIMEAKFQYLQTHYYGKDGEKIDGGVRQQYLTENVVCFRQVLIRSYYYVYETDANGDDIYYLPSENNAKVNNIAYDKVNGTTRSVSDTDPTPVTDKNGEAIYYLESGKIAYDKENGVRAIARDENGNEKTKKYTKEELAAHKEAAEEILAEVEVGDYAAFESLLEEFETSGDEAYLADGAECFLYTTGDNNNDYLNDIADALAGAKEGEVKLLSHPEYGYNVVMKYPIPENAAMNSDYEEWFPDLATRVAAKLFHAKCAPYMEKVVVNDEAFKALPSMKEIGTNYKY